MTDQFNIIESHAIEMGADGIAMRPGSLDFVAPEGNTNDFGSLDM